MDNYTEKLKNYWELKDLLFVATLIKSKDQSHGYFNNFINPINNKKLFYPDLDDLKVDDKRVSFYWGDVQELEDAKYILI